MSIAIAVDPHALRDVARGLRKIHIDLDQQCSILRKLEIELDHALKGSAIKRFEERFDHWLTNLQDVSHKLCNVASTLDHVAALADEQIHVLHELDSLNS